MKHSKNMMKLRTVALLIDTLLMCAIGVVLCAIWFIAGWSFVWFLIAMVVMAVLYPAVFEAMHTAATPGMMVLKLHVEAVGMQKGYAPFFKRFVWRIISCIPFGFGYWVGFANPTGSTFYDKISGTTVEWRGAKIAKKLVPCVYRKRGASGLECFPITEKGVVFGRNPQLCDVLFDINEAGVSRCHCSLTYNAQTNMFLLEDIGSTYGTFLEDGKKVIPGKFVALSPDEKFYVASKKNAFVVGFMEESNDSVK